MPSSDTKFSPDKQLDGGFTLIEIVMVLVLLGILSAVAVPKYFDLQEEGNKKTCQYNRGVVLESLISRSAIARISDDASIFDNSNQEAGQKSSEAITAEIGGEGCTYGAACQKHCPSGGVYSVIYTKHVDGNADFTVTCFFHGSSTSNSGSSSTFFGKSEADFEAWLKGNYDKLMDFVFTTSKGGNANAVIDSNTQNAILDDIRQSLEKEGFQLDKSILTISREDIGFFDSYGNDKHTKDNPSNPQTGDNPLHWRAVLKITVAEKTADMQKGDVIAGKTYTMTLDYNDKWSKNETDIRKPNGFGPLTPGANDGNVDCKVDVINGQYVIRPQS